MKTLKDSILEKLKIDDVSLVKEEFPADGTISDMIEFLEDAGFKKVTSWSSWDKSVENFKKYNVKCFSVDKSSTSIVEIIDRSNSKLKNKLFSIMLRPFKNYDDRYRIYNDITIDESWRYDRIVSKEEFLKELSEIL